MNSNLFKLVLIIKKFRIKFLYIQENKRRMFYVNNVAYHPFHNTPYTNIYVQYRFIHLISTCSFFYSHLRAYTFFFIYKNNHSKYVKMFTMTIYRGGHIMKRVIWKRSILTVIILSALVVFAGCQNNSAEKENNESNADEIDEIVGIEPGSGTMDIAENAVEGY